MSCILVTGSEGNIGPSVVASLHRHIPDAEIIRVSRRPITNLSAHETAFVGDLCDAAFAARLFREQPITHVVHAAAPTYNAETATREPFAIFRVDASAFLHILSANRERRAKIIYLSSSTVYESSTEVPFAESLTDRIALPTSPVGLAKCFGERALKLSAQEIGHDFTIWRLFNVVSPREDHAKPGAHVYVEFYRQLFVERVPAISIMGDGHQTRSFTWVDDVAEMIARFLDDARTSGETFNLAGEEPKTLIELEETLLDIGHRTGILPTDYRPETTFGKPFSGVDSPKRIPDLNKLHRVLDGKCPTDFRACMEKFVAEKQSYAHA
jgi:UDP-glucose 4-epimerase